MPPYSSTTIASWKRPLLELAQQIGDALRLRHERRRPHDLRDLRVADRHLGHLNQILHDDEPDDVVEVVGEDRQPRVFLLLHELAQVVDRRVGANRDDVRPRRHHFAHERLAEVDDRSQQPALVGAAPARRRRGDAASAAPARRSAGSRGRALGRADPADDERRQRRRAGSPQR